MRRAESNVKLKKINSLSDNKDIAQLFSREFGSVSGVCEDSDTNGLTENENGNSPAKTHQL